MTQNIHIDSCLVYTILPGMDQLSLDEFHICAESKMKDGPENEWVWFDRKRDSLHQIEHIYSFLVYKYLIYRLWCDCGLFTFYEFNDMKRNATRLQGLSFVALAAVCSCLFVKIWKSNVKKSFTYARFLLNAIKSKSPNDSLFIQFYYLLNSFIEFEAVLYWKGVAALALVFYSSRIIFYISH